MKRLILVLRRMRIDKQRLQGGHAADTSPPSALAPSNSRHDEPQTPRAEPPCKAPPLTQSRRFVRPLA